MMIPEGVRNIGWGAFVGCSNMTSVTMSEGVKIVEQSAFEGCSGLTSVSIPSSVTSIGPCSFSGCRGLTSVTIPEGVTNIGARAFSGCCGLTSVAIPPSVRSIWGSAFEGTPYYDNQPVGMLILESGVLYKYRGKCPPSVTIPSGVTSIGGGAFPECGELTSLTIPDGVTNVDSWAFVGCTNLTTVGIEKDGKVVRVSVDEFCKKWKLRLNSLRTSGVRPVLGVGALRSRRLQRQKGTTAAKENAKLVPQSEAEAANSKRKAERAD